MKDLKGKVVLVTGAARGMGRLHAENFAREGARVAVTDIDAAELEKAAGELRDAGYEVRHYVLDVSDREACFRVAERVEAELGPVDVLINNAAIALNERVLEAPEEHFRRITEVNYLGYVWMMQAVVPGITDCIRQELRGSGVNFTIVNPGLVSTGLVEGARPPIVAGWQDPRKVADAVLEAVKRNRAEVFVPRFIGHLVALGRGLGFPKFLDIIFRVLRVDRAFATMKRERGRPF